MREAILVYIILQVKGLPVISFFSLLFLVSYLRILWLTLSNAVGQLIT
jgi:hypothetical protein